MEIGLWDARCMGAGADFCRHMREKCIYMKAVKKDEALHLVFFLLYGVHKVY